MAAPRFTCTSCSGTGKQRIPSTRTPSGRTCERCGGSGVLVLEEADTPDDFRQKPAIPRGVLAVATTVSAAVPTRRAADSPAIASPLSAPHGKVEKAIPQEVRLQRAKRAPSAGARGAAKARGKANSKSTAPRKHSRKSTK